MQEYNYKGTYTYIYTDQNSYEPLAHVFYNHKDDKLYLSYYHTDQIGIPREQTDQFGNLLWLGNYDAWGSLKEEQKIYPNAHQPFRLQNQYCDPETGLHYNFFRYYDPIIGRFTTQDPIGLLGGENLYQFSPNAQMWVDPFGLATQKNIISGQSKRRNLRKLINQILANPKTSFTEFKNRDNILPAFGKCGKITYTEHDYNPLPTDSQRANGATRGKRRIVIGSDGSMYFTNNHYKSFVKIKLKGFK